MSGFATKDGCEDHIGSYSIPAEWWSRVYEYPWAARQAEADDIVVDAGCGITHPFKNWLADNCKHVYAVDLSPDILKIAKPDNMTALCESITKLSIPSGTVDKVFCISTLEHMAERKAALVELARILKPDGKLIVTIDVPTISVDDWLIAVRDAGLSFADIASTRRPSNILEETTGRYGAVLSIFCSVLQKAKDPITFTHDFKNDIAKIRFDGDPYALVRMGDGEFCIATGKHVVANEGWKYRGEDTPVKRGIIDVINSNVSGLYLGISCPCCNKEHHSWYLSHARMPAHRITYANLFVNNNYGAFMEKFKKLKRADYTLVSCKNGDIAVPENSVNVPFDWTDVVDEMCRSDKLILVAAGPAKCGMIYDYWMRAKCRQIVLDVGSTVDPIIHGKPTRCYHDPKSAHAKQVCRWS